MLTEVLGQWVGTYPLPSSACSPLLSPFACCQAKPMRTGRAGLVLGRCPQGGLPGRPAPCGHHLSASGIQPAPAGDVAVVYVEADDLEIAFTMLACSPESFDRWFRDHIHQVHGATWGHASTVPELVLDFDINRTPTGASRTG